MVLGDMRVYPSGNAHYLFMVDVKRWKEGEKQFRCLEPRTSNPKSENEKRAQILDGLVIGSLVGVMARLFYYRGSYREQKSGE